MSGSVVWLTGLPASGKSTLARRIARSLEAEGVCSCILDSDRMREALVPERAYTEQARADFYETLARLAAMLAKQGLVVLVAATAHRRSYRHRARELAPRFVEVYVCTPAVDCAGRDPKGLYAAANSGEVTTLPGAGATYEPPRDPEIIAGGGFDLLAVEQLVELLRQDQ